MEDDGFLSEHDVFVWDVALKVNVDACSYAMHVRDNAVDAWFTVEEADLVREIINDG